MWNFSTFYAFIAINSILSICFTVSKNFCMLYIYFIYIKIFSIIIESLTI